MVRLFVRLVVIGLSVWVAAKLIPGFHLGTDTATLIGVPVVIGAINAMIRPLVMSLACGLIVLTLGLFTLVINALMLLLAVWFAGALGLNVAVDGFGAAVLAALVISIVSFVLSVLVPDTR